MIIGDDVEELGRHRDHPFPVGLGRGDHQERDHLTVGALILADRQLTQLQQLLAADAGQPTNLDQRPRPERPFRRMLHDDLVAAVEVAQPNLRVRHLAQHPGSHGVLPDGQAPVAPASELHDRAVAGGQRGRLEALAVVVSLAKVLNKQRQQRLPQTGVRVVFGPYALATEHHRHVRRVVARGEPSRWRGWTASFVARLPEIRDQVWISVELLGLLLTVGALTGLLGSLIVGPVIRMLGTRRVMIVGELLYVCALPTIGFSSTPTVLAIGLVALALVDVFIDVAMNMQASAVSNRRHHPAISRLHGVWSMGTVTGGLVAAGVAAVQVAVHLHLVVASAVLAVAVLAIRSGLLRTDEHQAAPRQEKLNGRRWRVAPTLVALGVSSAAAVPLDVVPGEWATFRLADDLNAGAALAAAAFAAYTIGATTGGFTGDAIVVRTGRTHLIQIGAILSLASLSAASLIPIAPAALAGFFMAGLGVALVIPQLADAAALAPGRRGSGFAVLFVANRTAGLLIPIAMGTVASATGGIGLAMVTLTVPCAVVLIAAAATAMPVNDR